MSGMWSLPKGTEGSPQGRPGCGGTRAGPQGRVLLVVGDLKVVAEAGGQGGPGAEPGDLRCAEADGQGRCRAGRRSPVPEGVVDAVGAREAVGMAVAINGARLAVVAGQYDLARPVGGGNLLDEGRPRPALARVVLARHE